MAPWAADSAVCRMVAVVYLRFHRLRLSLYHLQSHLYHAHINL